MWDGQKRAITPQHLASFLLLAAFALVAAPGCGYRPIGYDEGVGDARTVSVVTLRNDSSVVGVERIVTDSLRREFLRRGALQLVSDPGRADLVVTGTIPSFRVVARTVSSIAGALEFVVDMRLDLNVRPRTGGPVDLAPFKIHELDATAIYPASADVEAARKNQVEAVRRVADVLAARAHDTLELRLRQ